MFRFSLILCTLNRIDELKLFFDSLSRQNYKNFECIVVDQNIHNRVYQMTLDYEKVFNLKYIKSDRRGLSINRNIGLRFASGDIVAFPDDDCEYLPDTLLHINNKFNQLPHVDIITINVRDKIRTRFYSHAITLELSRFNYYAYGISMGIFVRCKIKKDLYFDEKMGVGAYWGAGEESDFLSMLLDNNYKGIYYGDIYVLHPSDPTNVCTMEQLKHRYISYSLGYGALMKKEIFIRRKYRFIGSFLFDLFTRLCASCIPVKKRILFWYTFKYRLLGFCTYKYKVK